jgi:predicted nucleotidyltransferase
MMTKEAILSFLKSYKNSPQNLLFAQMGLFGSYARGEADPYSDVDVAVRIDHARLKEEDVWSYFDAIAMLKKAIWERFGVASDIYDLDSTGILSDRHIAQEIIYV